MSGCGFLFDILKNAMIAILYVYRFVYIFFINIWLKIINRGENNENTNNVSSTISSCKGK